MNSWEEYTILSEADDDNGLEGKRLDLTERFEDELTKLIKKYHKQEGLMFTAKSSERTLELE